MDIGDKKHVVCIIVCLLQKALNKNKNIKQQFSGATIPNRSGKPDNRETIFIIV